MQNLVTIKPHNCNFWDEKTSTLKIFVELSTIFKKVIKSDCISKNYLWYRENGKNIILKCSILKIFGQFWCNSKNFRKSIPNIDKPYFQLKRVQYTGLPFLNQDFAEKIDQNLKKLDKSIKFWQIFQNYDFSTTRFVNWVKLNTHRKFVRKIHKLRPKEKNYRIPIIFSRRSFMQLFVRVLFVLSLVNCPCFVSFFSTTPLSQNIAFRFLRLFFRISI